MRFAKGQNPYKNNMLALFYREGRKRLDAQLFLGFQPEGVWRGLYVPTPLLALDSPMAGKIKNDPQGVIDLAQDIGVGDDIDLVACKKYGEVDRTLDPIKVESFLEGPHLCALQTREPVEVCGRPLCLYPRNPGPAGATRSPLESLFRRNALIQAGRCLFPRSGNRSRNNRPSCGRVSPLGEW